MDGLSVMGENRAFAKRFVMCVMALALALVSVTGGMAGGNAQARERESSLFSQAANVVQQIGQPSAEQLGQTSAQRSGKWILIDLSEQRLTAYLGNKVVYSTRISSGTAKYPTVRGTFKVYWKVYKQRMRGGTGKEKYDLANVPHVMYFYQGYAIHGAYWHNNFGRPMSHGCINTPLGAAQWLYNWTPRGTPVVVRR